MRKVLRGTLLVVFVGLFLVSNSQAFRLRPFSPPKIKVMDQNMFLGADLSPLLGGDLSAVEDVIAEIIASNYPARAAALAKVIRTFGPDVVCIQEAWIFEYLPLGISWNFKDLLLAALGNEYREVVTNEGLMDVDFRSFLGVRIKDQDVVIARKYAKVGNKETFTFADNLQIVLPLAPPFDTVTVTRGVSTARLKIKKRWYTIVNTHLEAFDAEVRVNQAVEVVEALEGVKEPIILAGDFNSQPGWEAYNIIAERFEDAWPSRILGRQDPGFTFGRDDLISDDAVFDERIDFVFTRNHRSITLLGLTIGKNEFSKTEPIPPTGIQLWPSDHLGLFFILILPQPNK